LVSQTGSITIEGGAGGPGVAANGSGDVLLEARGAGGDVITNADVVSGTGNITLDADNDLTVNAAVTTGGTGTIYATAGNDATVSGSLNNANGDLLVDVLRDFSQTGVIQSVAGDVGLIAGNNLVQGSTSSVASGGNLLVKTGDDWTMVGNATATVDGSQLLGSSGGTITLGRVIMSNAVQNHVGLEAVVDILDGNLGDANIQESSSVADTVVSLRAGGEIGSTGGGDASTNVQALDLAVDRVAAESSFGIHLHQMASGLDLVVGNVLGQSISIAGVLRSEFNGTTPAVLAESGIVAALEDLVTNVNGEIELVVDGGNLTFIDGVGNDGPNLKDDPEVLASGVLGRIDVRAIGASGVIELGDNVQFHAEKITAEYSSPSTRPMPLVSGLSQQDRAIYLASDSIMFGADVELFTGLDQGTARLFSARPVEYIVNDNGTTIPVNDPFPAESAFYDASTVSTSAITQAGQRNLSGTLFIDIGNAGERGLTVDIDWGADTLRYQQLNGLSADSDTSVGVSTSGQPLAPGVVAGSGALDVEHYYTDMDIFFSRENGRSSVTSPLEVRFAVRHHESIFIEAGVVQQGITASEPVSGGIVSSTDDPATPPGSTFGLESGHHRFLIPNVPEFSVPFIPEREVIPVFSVAAFLPIVEPNFVAIEAAVSSTTASGFVSVARDEYFQLRALRPDQNAEPYGVFRLTDDIMTGDKLLQLQRSLPDGRYEIEYVLGDTFSRVILRFDVRNGEPIIPEDVLDEGELLLKEMPEVKGIPEAKEHPEANDQTLFAPQSEAGVALIIDPSQDSVVIYSGEAVSETVAPESAEGVVEPNGKVKINALEEENAFEVEVDPGESSAVNLEKDRGVDLSGLPALSVGVVLTTALQRRRQNLERKRLSRAARFAVRRTEFLNLHDSEST
jgi:hypothetical protein